MTSRRCSTKRQRFCSGAPEATTSTGRRSSQCPIRRRRVSLVGVRIGLPGVVSLLVSVTKLGDKASGANGAATAVVNYLTGDQPSKGGHRADVHTATPEIVGPGNYYADSAQQAGRWHGRGAAAMIPSERLATVDPAMLQRVLLGQNPATGQQLVGAIGSAGRAVHDNAATVALTGPPSELLNIDQAAKLIDVDPSYLRRLARQTASPPTGLPGATATPQTARLDASRTADAEWRVTRAEVERFKAERKEPQVVLGYDLTYSVPKSVSIAWAAADNDGKATIEDALHQAVDKALSYIEDNAIAVRRGRGQEPGDGMIAASFLHDTSRELEPQLHVHVVVANMAAGPDGRVQALDGRGLYAHGSTSGHLAEAEIQSILNQQGYAFTKIRRGIAHLVDVPQTTVDAMSTRRAQIMAEVRHVGTDSPTARQFAAYATRAAKDASVDRHQLQSSWDQRLADTGLGPNEIRALTTHDAPLLWTHDDSARLHQHLSSTKGVTEQTAIFDRRNVIEATTDFSGGRLNADEVIDLADRWLNTDQVIELRTQDGVSADLIGDAGKVTLTPGLVRYTTPDIIHTEQTIALAYPRGHNIGAGVVDPAITQAAIERWQTLTGHTLGADQAAMVHAITSSGDRFQAVVGPAGSGKTAALEVAARAWEADGYTLYGAAVNGTAAEVLQASTGIGSTTVAGVVRRLDHNPQLLDARSVVIVDEASTLGNRAHAALVRHVERAGATMRTIGDPAQHASVEAGGMWAHLTRLCPERTPTLTENRRQQIPAMADVRLAATDYRNGRIAKALERLDTNQRIITAATSRELLDTLTTDWYVSWQRHLAQPDSISPSRMLAETHSARRELNVRAQALLHADGIITGPGITLGDSAFYVGDRVMARAQNRKLRPEDGDRNSYVRNGTKGTVVSISEGPTPSLIVDFEQRGPIVVPHDWLTTKLRDGVNGGLTPAYAMTTHAAQGDTYSTSHSLLTDRSSTEGQYVALTRGQHDVRFYAVDAAAFAELTPASEHQLPIVTDTRELQERVEAQLTRAKPVDLATVADFDIADVLVHTRRPLAELESLNTPNTRRAAELLTKRAVADTISNPPAPLVAVLGKRDRQRAELWDQAAGHYATYNLRWKIEPADGQIAPALNDNSPPRQRDGHEQLLGAMVDARADNNRRLSAPDLARTRRQIVDDLQGLRPDSLDYQNGVARQLEQRIALLAKDRDQIEQSLSRLSTRKALKKDPNGPEVARRFVADTVRQLDVARAHLADIAATQQRAPQVAAQRDRASVELAVVDTLINRHVETALAEPRPYRTQTLGERPTDPAASKRWDQAAVEIERYRVGQLGCTHHTGPITPDSGGLAHAIGTRPDDPGQARKWEQTRQTVNAIHHTPGPDPARALRISR